MDNSPCVIEEVEPSVVVVVAPNPLCAITTCGGGRRAEEIDTIIIVPHRSVDTHVNETIVIVIAPGHLRTWQSRGNARRHVRKCAGSNPANRKDSGADQPAQSSAESRLRQENHGVLNPNQNYQRQATAHPAGRVTLGCQIVRARLYKRGHLPPLYSKFPGIDFGFRCLLYFYGVGQTGLAGCQSLTLGNLICPQLDERSRV